MMETWHLLITIGILFFVVEIFTSGFIAGSVGVGFFFSALGNYIGMRMEWQIILFAIGVATTYFLIKPIVTRYSYGKSPVRTNSDALIGKIGIVSEKISLGRNIGRVSIDGDDWSARTLKNEVVEVGTPVKVINIESIVLIVEPIK